VNEAKRSGVTARELQKINILLSKVGGNLPPNYELIVKVYALF